MRLLIGDVYGRVIAEAEPLLESFAEVLNGVGRASMLFSRFDPKATIDNLRFGNRIYIELANGLRWGGVIDPPRNWSGDYIGITAYSGEYLLGWRTTGKGRYFSGASKGQIFRSLLDEALPIPGLRRASMVWEGGVSHSPDYHLGNLLSLVRDSVCGRLGTADFAVVPSLRNGVITLTAELHERRGVDTNLLLVEGGNINAATLSEQGEIVNDWTIAGADISSEVADGWGDGRLIASASDEASIARYGRRQGSAVFAEITIPETLAAKASSLRDEYAWPRNIFSLSVVDAPPAPLASYGVGDIVRLQLFSCGFNGVDTRVRVIGREYFAADSVAHLIVQEVI